jgi:capsular polysaccharide transport system permease protein
MAAGFITSLDIQRRVIGAVVLRDLRTRFGRNPAAYIIAVLWPFAHLVVLLVVYVGFGRKDPVGTNVIEFLSTGILPFIIWLYPTRMTTQSTLENRPLLFFSRVTIFDIVIARSILETLTAFAVLGVYAAFLGLFFVEIRIHDPARAFTALCATIYLAVSLGALNALIALINPRWPVMFGLFTILSYITCGAFFVPDALPEPYRTYLSYFPLVHSVEWFRSGYYANYPAMILSETYLLTFSTAILCAALVFERLARGRLLRMA